jgi:hypothetical protein
MKDMNARMIGFTYRTLMVGVALVAVGCGRGPGDRCAISGSVTLDEEPVDGGSIQISPLDSEQTSASGAMIVGGHFAIPRESGLKPGKYRIRIYWADMESAKAVLTVLGGGNPGKQAPQVKERIPARYNTQSELTAEVRQGDANTFDFRLSKTQPPRSTIPGER